MIERARSAEEACRGSLRPSRSVTVQPRDASIAEQSVPTNPAPTTNAVRSSSGAEGGDIIAKSYGGEVEVDEVDDWRWREEIDEPRDEE